MDIESFALSHRLRTQKAEDNEIVMRGTGNRGELYDNHDGRLGACFIKNWRPQIIKRLEDAGVHIHTDGDGEGQVVFDPADEAQVRLIRPYKKIELSPEEQKRRAILIARVRHKTAA